ncbi:MAG: hypothetical protein WDZ90_02295 [Candidatus Paceibacterota bacterium]
MMRSITYGLAVAFITAIGFAVAPAQAAGELVGNQEFHSLSHRLVLQNPDTDRWDFSRKQTASGSGDFGPWAQTELVDEEDVADTYILIQGQEGNLSAFEWVHEDPTPSDSSDGDDLFSYFHERSYSEGHDWEVLNVETISISLGSSEQAELWLFELEINGNRRHSAFIVADLETAVGKAYYLAWARNIGVTEAKGLREAASAFAMNTNIGVGSQ